MTATAPITTIRFFEVGGCVRDELLGLTSKDIDFSVECPAGFNAMTEHLKAEGFVIFVETVDKLTVRAHVPEGHPLRARTHVADFVLARRESGFTDGRNPDHVEPGTLADDLARRDFTCNAVAKDPETGELIDPHGGVDDLEAGLLRFVGDPNERIREDALRVLRGLRFMVTKGLRPTAETWAALNGSVAVEMLAVLPGAKERCFEELKRMFAHDTLATLDLLASLDRSVRDALFPAGLSLTATLATPKGRC